MIFASTQRIRVQLGSHSLALPARNHAAASASQGCLTLDSYKLGFQLVSGFFYLSRGSLHLSMTTDTLPLTQGRRPINASLAGAH